MAQWGKYLLSKPASTGKRDNPGKLSSDLFIGVHLHSHTHTSYMHTITIITAIKFESPRKQSGRMEENLLVRDTPLDKTDFPF